MITLFTVLTFDGWKVILQIAINSRVIYFKLSYSTNYIFYFFKKNYSFYVAITKIH